MDKSKAKVVEEKAKTGGRDGGGSQTVAEAGAGVSAAARAERDEGGLGVKLTEKELKAAREAVLARKKDEDREMLLREYPELDEEVSLFRFSVFPSKSPLNPSPFPSLLPSLPAIGRGSDHQSLCKGAPDYHVPTGLPRPLREEACLALGQQLPLARFHLFLPLFPQPVVVFFLLPCLLLFLLLDGVEEGREGGRARWVCAEEGSGGDLGEENLGGAPTNAGGGGQARGRGGGTDGEVSG